MDCNNLLRSNKILSEILWVLAWFPKTFLKMTRFLCQISEDNTYIERESIQNGS